LRGTLRSSGSYTTATSRFGVLFLPREDIADVSDGARRRDVFPRDIARVQRYPARRKQRHDQDGSCAQHKARADQPHAHIAPLLAAKGFWFSSWIEVHKSNKTRSFTAPQGQRRSLGFVAAESSLPRDLEGVKFTN
jgi:hypothetical protein